MKRSPLKRSKYGNKRVKTTLGKTYDSKGEAAYAAHLQALKLAGEILSWERQVRIPLMIGKHKLCTYVMDFVIHNDSQTVTLCEYKGYVTDLWKLKWKILEATLPEVQERMWPDKEVKMELVMHR